MAPQPGQMGAGGMNMNMAQQQPAMSGASGHAGAMQNIMDALSTPQNSTSSGQGFTQISGKGSPQMSAAKPATGGIEIDALSMFGGSSAPQQQNQQQQFGGMNNMNNGMNNMGNMPQQQGM